MVPHNTRTVDGVRPNERLAAQPMLPVQPAEREAPSSSSDHMLPPLDVGVYSLEPSPYKSKPLTLSASLGLPPRLRMSLLSDEEERTYLYSSTIDQGTFGKMRIALRLSDDQIYCVKELRFTYPAQGPNKDPLLSRHGRCRTDLSVGTMPGIEAAMAHTYGGPFRLETHFQIAEKHYLFFPLAIGCVYRATRQLMGFERSVLARYTAHQVTQTLVQMHHNHVLHLDVKSRNILVHHQAPYVALADFGTVQLGATKPSVYGFRSTYCPPEAYRLGSQVDGRADLWALGASLLEILSPRTTLGLESVLSPQGTFDVSRSYARLAAFFVALQNPTLPAAAPIQAGLEACKRVDAPLVHLIISHLLVPASHRDGAPAFMQRLDTLSPQQQHHRSSVSISQTIDNLTMNTRTSQCVQAMQNVRRLLPSHGPSANQGTP